jgi:hypothetical protein
VLGKTYLLTLIIISNLARVLYRQSKYVEAEAMNRQRLRIQEEVLYKSYPDTLTSVYCLAHSLQSRGAFEEASLLCERVCTGYKSSLGAEHPTIKACIDNYSIMLSLLEEAR